MLKRFDDLTNPDPRMRSFVKIDSMSGKRSELSLEDLHEEVSQVALCSSVPEDIVTQFDKVRNAFVYSWFVYEFSALAEQHAYITMEHALRMRWDAQGDLRSQRRPGFRKLLQTAVTNGWISEEGFSVPCQKREMLESLSDLGMAPPSDDVRNYCDILAGSLPFMRNSLAHGSSYQNTPAGALLTITIAAELINQLFRDQLEGV